MQPVAKNSVQSPGLEQFFTKNTAQSSFLEHTLAEVLA